MSAIITFTYDVEYDIWSDTNAKRFSYSLDKDPDAVFCQDETITVIQDFNHFCYDHCRMLKKLRIYTHIDRVNNEPITYGQVFSKVDAQVDNDLTAIETAHPSLYQWVRNGVGIVGNVSCNHRFMESVSRVGNTSTFVIDCGS